MKISVLYSIFSIRHTYTKFVFLNQFPKTFVKWMYRAVIFNFQFGTRRKIGKEKKKCRRNELEKGMEGKGKNMREKGGKRKREK